MATGPKANYLECELGGAHHFYDVEGSPADVVPQHLQLLRRKGLVRKPSLSSRAQRPVLACGRTHVIRSLNTAQGISCFLTS